jgi:hypothetical protein
MNNIIKDARRFLNNRFSGNVAKNIKNVEKCLQIVSQTLRLYSGDNFWLSWYKSYLEMELKYFRKFRFIPGSFVIRKNTDDCQELLAKIKKNDKIVLKDILLPLPLSGKMQYIGVVANGVLEYLLDDIGEELFYSMIPDEDGPYEYKAVRLAKGDIVIDAGACAGEFSALAGIKGCKVYAFEPMPDIVDNYLSKTAEWNPNITICQCALSDKPGELIFNKNISNAINLDAFVEENNLPSVDFIKADIEGAERYMLMGAKRVLKEFAPKLAVCTYHLPDDPQILRKLILEANPDYIIEERFNKIYAYVQK